MMSTIPTCDESTTHRERTKTPRLLLLDDQDDEDKPLDCIAAPVGVAASRWPAGCHIL